MNNLKKDKNNHNNSRPFFNLVKSFLNRLFGYVILFIIFIAIVFSIPTLLSGFASHIIENLNPFNMQQKAIVESNKVQDAYSTVEGVTINEIPLNKFDSFVNLSSISSEKIQISIPKLVNISPLFNDDTNIIILKTALKNSINQDELKKQTRNFEVFYNSNLILEYNNKISNEYINISKTDKKKMKNKIKTLIKDEKNKIFEDWDIIGDTLNVEYSLDDDGKTLDIEGYATLKDSKFLIGNFLKKEAKIKASFKKNDSEWKYISKSLEVGER